MANIILSQLVWKLSRCRPCWSWAEALTETTAASGACATIASDALMNPFDGAHFPLLDDKRWC
jgi:hypothetical protein